MNSPKTPPIRGKRAAPSVIIVGAGMGGLAAAFYLKRAGVTNLTMLERGPEVGGTWRANTYPGIAVDTSILQYSLSFDPNPGWTRLYANGAELHSYLISISHRHDIRRHIKFNETVDECRYDVRNQQWIVQTSTGARYTADILISATGALSTPATPDIPGLQNFRGRVLHSAQWDPAFDATGTRIAQIGSGATAAQLVPEIAKSADHVYVYQRSPAWVFPRNDRPIGRREGRLYEKFPVILRARRWKRFWDNDRIAYGFEKQNGTVAKQTAYALDFIDRSISDPSLREAVIPDYEVGCKRRVMSDDWYPALQRDNVDLVPHALERITERSVIGKDGIEREVDTIIFSTGFAVADFMPMKVFGATGQELHDTWSDGAATHLGISVADYPNLFLVAGPNTGIGAGSSSFMIECQAKYIARAVRYMTRHGIGSLNLRPEVQSRSYAKVQQRLAGSVFGSGCVGWYQSANGRIDTVWPGLNAGYWARTKLFSPRHFRRQPINRTGRSAQPLERASQ